MNDDESPKSPGDFSARLRQAKAAGRRESDEGAGGGEPMSGMGMAFRIGLELVSALVIGVGIGYLLDRWLETKPWFLVVFFFVGAAAGVLNVYRAAGSIGLIPPTGEREAGSDEARGNADRASGPDDQRP